MNASLRRHILKGAGLSVHCEDRIARSRTNSRAVLAKDLVGLAQPPISPGYDHRENRATIASFEGIQVGTLSLRHRKDGASHRAAGCGKPAPHGRSPAAVRQLRSRTGQIERRWQAQRSQK